MDRFDPLITSIAKKHTLMQQSIHTSVNTYLTRKLLNFAKVI